MLRIVDNRNKKWASITIRKLPMQSEYLKHLLSGKTLAYNVSRMLKTISSSKVKFDAIAFRGNSGALLAAPLSILTKKPLILVRKELNNHHSSYTLEGCTKKNCKYIIVDDMIDTGKTISIINLEIENAIENPTLTGIFIIEGETGHKHIGWILGKYNIKCNVYITSTRKIIEPKTPKLEKIK